MASKKCQAITKSGAQCSRDAEEGSKFCWQHLKSEENRRNIPDSVKEKAATMLANPDIKTKKEVYTTLDIPESTFYDWLNKQKFIDLINSKIDKFTDRETAEVWKALIEEATEGNIKAIKLFFEMKGKYRQKHEVDHSGQVTQKYEYEITQRILQDPEQRETARELFRRAVNSNMGS